MTARTLIPATGARFPDVLRWAVRKLRLIALSVGMMFLAGCWGSETLLFPEEEFIDPWGGEHTIARSAISENSDRPLTLSPRGKAFQITDDQGKSDLIAFVPFDFVEAEADVQYLTIISLDVGATEKYDYSIGALSNDGRELQVCFDVGTGYQEVSDRATLERLMREAILAARKDRESRLHCGRLTGFTPVPGALTSTQELSADSKQKALLTLETMAKAEQLAGRSTPAHDFLEFAGPSIECAGPYLGKVAFPQQGPNGELWYLMVVYFGDHADETVHTSDFAACGETVLKARRYISLDQYTDKLSTPYRIIAFDQNFRVFLDSGVKN